MLYFTRLPANRRRPTEQARWGPNRGETVKSFLFLDDWFIDARCDVDRVFPPAKLVKVFDWYSPDSDATHYNVINKLYEAWAGDYPDEEWNKSARDDMYTVTREDGENWTGKYKPGPLTLIGSTRSGSTAACGILTPLIR